MNKKDLLGNIYDDFFGVNAIKKENEKLINEVDTLNVSKNKKIESMLNETRNDEPYQTSYIEQEEYLKKEKDKKMIDFNDRIDKLYIDEKSKDLLKNIIEYMRKYDEKIEKKHISFNMCLYSTNKETARNVMQIILDASTYFHYLMTTQGAMYSIYDIDDVSKIADMFDSKNSVIMLNGFNNLLKRDEEFRDKFANKFNEMESKSEENLIIILNAKEKKEISEGFNNENLTSKFTDFEIQEITLDVQDAYNDVLDKLKENMDVGDEKQVKLLDYLTATYPNNTLNYEEYRDNLVNKILFTKKVPEYNKEKSLEEIFVELNELVGLDKVKQMLHDLVDLIELKEKAGDDLKIKNINLHMVFLGNPGTGKTTVARIVAQILYNLKYVKQNKLIEVSSKDLVAEYVGQTAPKTMSVIQKALGGVLFIDEAYTLATNANSQGGSFNGEAIATLIQAMENYRDNLVVIFAGYTEEMQYFLASNSGIVSRIGYIVEFEDYTEDQLIQIFKQMTSKAGFLVTDGAINKLRELIRKYKVNRNFGNARFIRNIYEKSIVKHASNVKNVKSKKNLITLTEKDINDENLLG